jgi:hypothetical protein
MLRKLSKELKIIKMYRTLRPVIKNHLFFLENRGQSVWGSVSEEDEKAIIELTTKACSLPGPILEIGALFGFTTQLIATYKPTEKELIAIENYSWNPFGIPPSDHRLITQRVLRYVISHCNTSIFDGSSQDFHVAYKGEKPSMVFIDAEHKYDSVKMDIDWALKLGIPIIAGHDYCDKHPGVVRAVDEYFQNNKKVAGSVWWHDVL